MLDLVLSIADMGFGTNAQPTIARIKEIAQKNEADLWLWHGDILYADGDEFWWDTAMREMQPAMARLPAMVTLGNHETFFAKAIAARTRLWMPKPTMVGVDEHQFMYYRLKVNDFSFMFVNTESNLNTPEINDVQQSWIAKTLAEDRAARKMIAVGHHRPIYCDSGLDELLALECNDYAEYLSDRVEDLYYKNRVAFVLAGHLHNYQRTTPVYKRKVVSTNYKNISAPFYVVNGGPGNREGNGAFTHGKVDPWYGYRTRDRSFLMMNFTNDGPSPTSNGKNVMKVNANLIRSTTNEVIDTFDVTQEV